MAASITTNDTTSPIDEVRKKDATDVEKEQSFLDPEWPELSATSKHIERNGWQQREFPIELTQLPDDISLPEKLRQILDWSIIPGSSWAAPPSGGGDDDVTEDEELQGAPEAVAASSVHEQEDLGGNTDANPSESSSVKRAHSHSTSLQSRPSTRAPRDVSSVKRPDADRTARLRTFLGKFARVKSDSQARAQPSRIPPTPIPTEECTGCLDDFPVDQLARIEACRHWYCKKCLNTLIVTAMATESSFPPKCCLSPIPIHSVLLSLTEEQRETYRVKSAEYALAPADRWYCPRPTCAKWLPLASLVPNSATNYQCSDCSQAICRTCRGPAHPVNTECPQDFGLEATLETAELEGWRRCHRCHAMVEHNLGCRHMTCRCRAEFCYVCGAVWQTCQCTEQDALRRRSEIQRRRDERIAAADAEAAEIARIIAEVEEMERAEAEARRLEEERRQREEEAQLAVMEQQRQEEEAAQLAAAEEAERQWLEAIKTSFEDDCTQMWTLLHNVLAFQQAQMNIRHETENSARETELAFFEMGTKAKYEALTQTIIGKYSRQREALRETQKEQRQSLESEQEEEEDRMFVQIQSYLKGKQNKEARLGRMLGELKQAQGDALKDLVQLHTHALYTLEVRRKVDLNGVKGAQEGETAMAEAGLEQKLYKLGAIVGSDRQWFEVISERRVAMLARHQEVGRNEIEAMEEPHGLQAWQAAVCQPMLPPDAATEDGEFLDTPELSDRSARHMNYHGPEQIEIQVSGAPQDETRSYSSRVGDSFDERRASITSRPQLGSSTSSFNEDTYLQPAVILERPVLSPPTPSSSSVSINVRHVRTPSMGEDHLRRDSAPKLYRLHTGGSASTTSGTESTATSRYYAGPQVITSSGLASPAFASGPLQRDRKGSTVTINTIPPVKSTDRKLSKESDSITAKVKNKWGFVKKREFTPEEIREKMRHAVGDAR